MKHLLISIILICIVNSTYAQSCDIDGVLYYTYQDIKTILDNKQCNSCHNSTGEASQWTYENYEKMVSVGDCDLPIIVHGDANESLLYDMINGGTVACGRPMPINQPPLTDQEVYAVESWINNGATEKCIPFYEDVVNVFGKYNCSNCHNTSDSWSYLSYDHILSKQESNICTDLIVPYSASTSFLYELIIGNTSDCDNIPNHEILNKTDVELIRDWINGGAQEGAFSLPVELTQFKLSIDDKQLINLSWSTASEIGTDRFIIQRNIRGAGFENIGEVQAVGNVDEPRQYTFKDEQSHIGIIYYRLLIQDLDGSFSYSRILNERMEPSMDILDAFPSPIMGGETLHITWYNRVERPQSYGYIVNPRGQVMQKILLYEGDNEVELSKLSNGLYYIVVQDYFDSYQFKRIVVIN